MNQKRIFRFLSPFWKALSFRIFTLDLVWNSCSHGYHLKKPIAATIQRELLRSAFAKIHTFRHQLRMYSWIRWIRDTIYILLLMGCYHLHSLNTVLFSDPQKLEKLFSPCHWSTHGAVCNWYGRRSGRWFGNQIVAEHCSTYEFHSEI